MLGITRCTNTNNTTQMSNREIKYIVLHYTAGTSSYNGVAKNIANYFATTKVQASADFIVDEGAIVQYNPDVKNRYTWAVGGSKYSSMSTSEGGKYYGICTNKNSISIEMCSKKINSSTMNATDADWYFDESTVANAVDLTKYLMTQYNISAANVIMHHHVTGKICPNPWCVNEAALLNWKNFKNRISATVNTSIVSTSKLQVAKYKSDKYKKSYTVSAFVGLNIRYGAGTDYSRIKTLLHGTKVTCYGYYNIDSNGDVWLYVKTNDGTLGYVSLKYLK